MAVQSRRATYLQKSKVSCAFLLPCAPEVSSRVSLVLQVISKAVFKFYPSIFYLLDKTFNHSDVPNPLKIWYTNESWRAGLLSAHSVLFVVFLGIFWCKILHALSQSLGTLISGVYNCEGQFSASCKVVHRGDTLQLHFASCFSMEILQMCPFLCFLFVFPFVGKHRVLLCG